MKFIKNIICVFLWEIFGFVLFLLYYFVSVDLVVFSFDFWVGGLLEIWKKLYRYYESVCLFMDFWVEIIMYVEKMLLFFMFKMMKIVR